METLDRWLSSADQALRTLSGGAHAGRRCPGESPGASEATLAEPERRLAGALMRVNHVGEVCAQALYQAQALSTRDDALREQFRRRRRARNRTIWPGPSAACRSWGTAPAC
jgi:ubiquinone biosynthesis monooxygenase Coq7